LHPLPLRGNGRHDGVANTLWALLVHRRPHSVRSGGRMAGKQAW